MGFCFWAGWENGKQKRQQEERWRGEMDLGDGRGHFWRLLNIEDQIKEGGIRAREPLELVATNGVLDNNLVSLVY